MLKPQTKWVLLVEDDSELRELLQSYLELQLSEKIKLVCVPDGVEASAKVRFQAYDCIITDLQMPKKEGRALVETIHQSPLNAKTPIIVLTGFPDKELLAKFPMCVLLEKPAPPDKVLSLVETQLKLGPLDRRVGAHMLNTMTECVQLLLERLIGVAGQFAAPKAKRRGEPFVAPFIRFFHWKNDAGVNRFAISFTQEMLKEMDKKLFSGQADHPPENVAMAATNTVLSNAARRMKSKTGSVVKSAVLTPARSEQPAELLDARGIILPLETPFGPLQILALC